MSELDLTLRGATEAGTLYEMLRRSEARAAGSIALLAPGQEPLTHAELLRQVEALSRSVAAAGVRPGDRVAICLPDGPNMAIAFLAVSSIAVSAPLNPAYREEEFAFYLADLQPRAILVAAGSNSASRAAAGRLGIPVLELQMDPAGGGPFVQGSASDSAEPFPVAKPDDHALLLHTSGTTSRPKLVPLTHGNLCASADSIAATLRLTPGDRCLNVMPLFHIHGLVAAVLSSLSAGGSVVCTPGFLAPEFFGWLEDFRPTWYTAVPTMHQSIVRRVSGNRDRLASLPLRLLRSSSAALPPKLFDELEKAFGVPVIEAYGMTEAAHQMASNPLPPGARKAGSVGIAAGPEVAVLTEEGRLAARGERGEVVIRGPSVTKGYLANPAANAEAFVDGWFRTGDQGRFDEDGYLFLTGRLKEIVNRGGEKISPREIDEILLGHPAVAQAVAFAVPDPTLGEDLGAAVVLREDMVVSPAELRRFVAGRVTDFKVPRRILVVSEIPKGPTGKLQRIGLAEKLGVTALSSDRVAYREPASETEGEIASLFEQVLRLESVGADDDFFLLGGDSMTATLLLTRIREAKGVVMHLAEFLESPTAAGLAARIEADPGVSAPLVPIPRASGGGAPILSDSQKRLWFLSQLEPGSAAYNRPASLRLRGVLHVEALERSIDEILERHETLRTGFSSVDGVPMASVSESRSVSLRPVRDLTALTPADREREVLRLAAEFAGEPFDLARPPLLRASLVKLGEEDYALLLVVHHIVFDGWSLEVFAKELTILHDAFSAGRASPLPPLPIQYSDFAVWQREIWRGERLEVAVEYWKERLKGLESLPLPRDEPSPTVRSFRAGQESRLLERGLVEALRARAAQHGTTLFMNLLAAYQVLLAEWTGGTDIAVGSPVANRNRSEMEPLIGFFVNTVVLRGDVSGDPDWRQLLGRVRKVVLEAHRHQELPFGHLIQALRPQRDRGGSPLFRVWFLMESPVFLQRGDASFEVAEINVPVAGARYDLKLQITEEAGEAVARFEYDADFFTAETIRRLAADYEVLLGEIAARPELRVGSVHARLTRARESRKSRRLKN